MNLARREFLGLAGGAVMAPAVACVAWGQAAQVTLKLHHFLPPVANGHARLLAPWAKKSRPTPATASGSTSSPRCSSAARRRSFTIRRATASPTSSGPCPARRLAAFPAIEVFELPFIAARRAVPNARAVQEFAEANLKEFAEVHPICFWAHDHGLVHANKPVKTMEDMKGLRLRSPTRLAGDALNALGVIGRPMPIAQLPEALAQKAVDGCVIPWGSCRP